MPRIIFVRRDDSQQTLEGQPGQSVMKLAMAHGIAEIEADCGGACACATCHVVVPEDWFARLPTKSSLEADMIDFVVEPTPTSRLSCQIIISDSLDGLVLRLPVRQR